jgi:hypothetical protein
MKTKTAYFVLFHVNYTEILTSVFAEYTSCFVQHTVSLPAIFSKSGRKRNYLNNTVLLN